jgi:hypothetical protein
MYTSIEYELLKDGIDLSSFPQKIHRQPPKPAYRYKPPVFTPQTVPVLDPIISSSNNPNNNAPPNPIIFHEWFLHCLYHYFSFIGISKLAQVNFTSIVIIYQIGL